MTPDQAATVSAEMAASRSETLAQSAHMTKLQAACAPRSVELYDALCAAMEVIVAIPHLSQHFVHIGELIKEIEA